MVAGRKGNSKGVKLHLSFHVEADIPARASICEAAICERGHLRNKLVRGSAYIADRLYGMEHAFFAELEKKGCRYCIRIKDEAAVDVIEELPVSEQDRSAGVLRQCRARLGLGKRTAQSTELRLVYVRGVDGAILDTGDQSRQWINSARRTWPCSTSGVGRSNTISGG